MQRPEFDSAIRFRAPSGFIAMVREEAAQRLMSVSEFLRQAALHQIETGRPKPKRKNSRAP